MKNTNGYLMFPRLAGMMFFQYMMFAVWWVPLAAYLTNIHLDSTMKALILSSMSIGCMASPIIGTIADRHFASQKILTILNLVTSALLLLAGLTTSTIWLFVFLLLAMLCYMPTWGLTSSIAMANAPSEKFSRIRVFGSIGWVISGVCSLIMVKIFKSPFDGTTIPFLFASGISLLAAILNLTLPDTPPSTGGKKGSMIDALGLRAFSLMKDRNFAVFIIFSFLSMIPFSLYWSYCSEFLLDKQFQYISIAMNWGQFAEMFFLLTIPFAIRKVGLRGTMILGLVALFIRCLSFYIGIAINFQAFYFLGILVHGLIFGYFYLGGQIYIDQKVPKELRAQAQGFIFFVTFGVGLLLGNFISGNLIENYSTTNNSITTYDWNSIWGITSIESMFLIVLFMIFFKEEKLK